MKMKLFALLPLAALGVYLAQTAAGTPDLPNWIPAGAQVYVEAQNFAALLKDWNGSPEKTRWLASRNYQAFSRTRLFQRLGAAQDEFAAVSGLPFGMSFAEQIAGGASALAVYDIGGLEMLYITRLSVPAPALEAAMPRFERREAAGTPYYVKSDRATGRTTAFATRQGYLFFATSEEHLAEALSLAAGQNGPRLAAEAWFQRAAQPRGELRMAANLELLAASPHFRSYWVQRNVDALKPFEGVIADLRRQAGVWTETRTITRRNAEPAPSPALQALAAKVPADVAFYRLEAAPAIAPIVQRLAGDPAATGSFTAAEDESSLETLIDQEPFVASAGSAAPALSALLANTRGALTVAGTRLQQDGVFVTPRAGFVLAGEAPWNEAAVRALLPGWSVAAEGNLLYLANHEPLLAALRTGGAAAPAPPPGVRTVYQAVFRHAAERQRLFRMLTLIDHASVAPGEDTDREPLFFSENLAGFSAVLARFQSAAIHRDDLGDKLTETVAYAVR